MSVNIHCIILPAQIDLRMRTFSLKINVAYIFGNHLSVVVYKNCVDMCQMNLHAEFQLGNTF